MYLRFITTYINANGDTDTGVFQALGYLWRDNDTSTTDIDALLELRDWFYDHLEVPDQFTKRKTKKETGTALSWYRDTAKNHIAKMHEMTQIMERYGIIVWVVRRADPGYIVYEDEFQIAAIPYREDRDKVR